MVRRKYKDHYEKSMNTSWKKKHFKRDNFPLDVHISGCWVKGLATRDLVSFLLTRGRKIESGIKRLRMRQILHTIRVNRNLQDTCPV